MNNAKYFLKHYYLYLGCEESSDLLITPSPLRNEIFCFNSKQPLIYTKWEGRDFFSIAPESKVKFEANLNISELDLSLDDLLPIIDDAFCALVDEHWIQKMFRMSIIESDLSEPDNIDLVEYQ